MWKCSRCNELVDEEFDVCWNCSSERDGTPQPVAQQEQPDESRSEPDPSLITGNETVPSEFNWGAFSLTPLWLLFHRRIGTALLLILFSFIYSLVFDFSAKPRPKGAYIIIWIITYLLVYYLLPFIVALYFGFVANEIAWKTRRYTSFEQLKEKQRGWNIAGKMVFIFIQIPLIIYGVYILFFAKPYR